MLQPSHVAHFFKRYWLILVAVLGFSIFPIAFAMFFVRHEHFVHFWDSWTYESEFIFLRKMLNQSGLGSLLTITLRSLSNQYTYLPIFLPAVSTFFNLGRENYIILNVIYYFLPWLFLSSYYFATNFKFHHLNRKQAFVLSCCILAFLPFVWQPLLFGMPDIGGVLLAVVILILSRNRRQKLAPLVGFSQGILLILMIAFRRYFAYWGAGFMVAFGVSELATCRERFEGALMKLSTTFIGGGVGLLVLGPRFISMLTADYGSIYHSYQNVAPYYNFFQSTVFSTFGVPISLACILSALFLLRNAKTRNLTIFLLIQAIVLTVLFLRVQAFSIHHFLLLLPLVSYLLVQGFFEVIDLLQNKRRQGAFILLVLVFLLTTFWLSFFPHPISESPYIQGLLPVYYPPPQRSDISSIKQLCSSLKTIYEPGQNIYVLSSSPSFNLDTVKNACDISVLRTAEIDGRDPFPESFFTAGIVISTEPLQLHQEEKFQQIIKIPYEAFYSQMLPNYQVVGTFQIENGIVVKIYQKIRQPLFNIAAEAKEKYLKHLNEISQEN